MSDRSWKTKKEIILENASRDPFLTINDLAELADTTSRYVRTILSEAGLSLMKLRKEYARQLSINESDLKHKFLLNRIINVSFQNKLLALKEEGLIFNKPGDLEILSDDIYNDYYYFYFQHFTKSNPWCLSVIYLKKDFMKINEIKKTNNSLNDLIKILLENITEKDYDLSEIEITIEPGAAQVAEYLNSTRLYPVLQARQILYFQERLSGLIITYMDSRQICFSLSANKGIVIKRKNAAG